MEETKDERRKRLAREASARFRERNPGYDTKKSQEWRENHPSYAWPTKLQNTERVAELKRTTPCSDCGRTFPEECMDFDHVEGEKVNNVGTMVAHGWSWDKIEAEIAKCDLVCACCHRIRTRKRRKE